MKYLFLVLLLLVSCNNVHTNEPDNYPKLNRIAALGQDGDVFWTCHEEDINDKLVWVQCDFHNQSSAPRLTRTCIKVSYAKNGTTEEFIQSRLMCLTLGPYDNLSNYAAFMKEKRTLLAETCGMGMGGCYMITRAIQPLCE